MEAQCVFCEVVTAFLNTVFMNSRLQRANDNIMTCTTSKVSAQKRTQ
jgi:hypothetical protein